MHVPESSSRRSILRLIDANLNRAAEGLRTCEDLARFLLDDQVLAQEAKHLRHAVIAAVIAAAGDDRSSLIAARDSTHDVGTQVERPASQIPKVELSHIAPAAAQRAQQALRVLEETIGLLGAAGAAQAASLESLRYRLYTLDKDLSHKISMRAVPGARGVQWRLCVLITESLCQRPWKQVAEAAMRAGADCIQLREKNLSDRELLDRASWLVAQARTHDHRPAIVINDRVDVALLSGADGVHLGQDDLSPPQAIELCTHFGRSLHIGLSTHDLTELDAALDQPIDYVGLGAMFSTTTKPREVAGIAYLKDALAKLAAHRAQGGANIGHLAIGGLTPNRAMELAQAGCQGVAVSSAICSTDDPDASTRDFIAHCASAV
jgi:thiamine-phosphate pyrophosphorylase